MRRYKLDATKVLTTISQRKIDKGKTTEELQKQYSAKKWNMFARRRQCDVLTQFKLFTQLYV
jgi:hypothetical protein